MLEIITPNSGHILHLTTVALDTHTHSCIHTLWLHLYMIVIKKPRKVPIDFEKNDSGPVICLLLGELFTSIVFSC